MTNPEPDENHAALRPFGAKQRTLLWGLFVITVMLGIDGAMPWVAAVLCAGAFGFAAVGEEWKHRARKSADTA